MLKVYITGYKSFAPLLGPNSLRESATIIADGEAEWQAKWVASNI